MDDDYSGDSFGGFSLKHSSVESSVTASVNDASAFESSRGSHDFTFHDDNTDTAAVETNTPKKKKVSRMTDGGLRKLSAIVRNTCERKGRTTYDEVADDIISELYGNGSETLDESDGKNIRRRVYDALNVLEALDIITREKKKDIKWNGIPDRNTMDPELMKEECVKLMNRIGRKTTYLNDLEEQIADLENLMLHTKKLLNSASTRAEGFSLPFILVQTSPHATVEVEISENMHMVYFDFNSTPFSLHDDATILKLLRCHQQPERANACQSSSVHTSPRSCIASSAGTRPFDWKSETHTPSSKVKKRLHV